MTLRNIIAHLSYRLSVSANRRIFAATLVVVVMTGIAKLSSVAKELVVANYFGTGEEVDAFLIAILLPMFAINVLAGSFGAAVVPTYIRIRESIGILKANQLFSTVLVLFVIILLLASFILSIIAPFLLPFLGSGFNDNNIQLTKSLFYWLIPVILFSGIGHMYSSAMNAGERFAEAAIAPAITPVFALMTLILFSGSWGIHALAIGTLLGAVIELIVLLFLVIRKGIPIMPRWYGMSEDLRIVYKQYTPMVVGAFLMSGTILVDQAMAAMLESGSVASLNYANKVVSLLLGVGAMALGTALLPHFSRMVAEGDWAGINNTLWTYSRIVLAVTIPLSVVLFLFSGEIIGHLFQRGEFTVGDASHVGDIQAFYVMQIPFYVLGIMGVRLLSALCLNVVLMYIAIVNLLINIAGNYFLMKYMGVAGIALSTSIVYALSTLMIYSVLRKQLSRKITYR